MAGAGPGTAAGKGEGDEGRLEGDPAGENEGDSDGDGEEIDDTGLGDGGNDCDGSGLLGVAIRFWGLGGFSVSAACSSIRCTALPT